MEKLDFIVIEAVFLEACSNDLLDGDSGSASGILSKKLCGWSPGIPTFNKHPE
jgi:hypothetical protein